MALLKVLWPLFLDTFKKEVRSKSVLLFVAVMIMMAVISFFLKNAFQEGADQLFSYLHKTCLENAPFWIGFFFAAAVGSSTMRSDLKSSVAMQIAAFALPSWAYVATRIVGAWAVVMIYEVLFVAGLFLLSWGIFPDSIWREAMGNLHFAWGWGLGSAGIYLLAVVLVAAILAMYFKELVALVMVYVFYLISLVGGYGFFQADHPEFGVKSIVGTLFNLVLPPITWFSSIVMRSFEEQAAPLTPREIIYLIWSLLLMGGWIWLLGKILRRKNYQV
jgi:hypothetical protein